MTNLNTIKEKALELLEKAKEDDYFEQVIHFGHLCGCEHINDYDTYFEYTEYAQFNSDTGTHLTKKAEKEYSRLFELMNEDMKEQLGFNLSEDLTDEQLDQCWDFEQEWHEDGSDMQLLQLEIRPCFADPWEEELSGVKIDVYTSYSDAPYFRGGELLQETKYTIEEFLKLKEIPEFKQIEGI